MNIYQLEYIIAVDTYRHFAKAAKACNITQPTLSTMIQKIEEELDVVIFDRSKQPVIPTESGKKVIEQAKCILKEVEQLKQISNESHLNLQGELRVAIIPTLAPYLLPLFLPAFLQKYENIKLKIIELNTDLICEYLRRNLLDVGILATPLHLDGFNEDVLFRENLFVYISKEANIKLKNNIIPEDIDFKQLWLLEEGHCLRSQIFNLCEMQKKSIERPNLEYEAGSIESLLKIVEMRGGITVIPELVTFYFSEQQKKQLRSFKTPVPAREISLVTYRYFVKEGLLATLKNEIINGVKGKLNKKADVKIISPN